MGDVVGRGEAANKKMAEKNAALDACVKLAQLGVCVCVCVRACVRACVRDAAAWTRMRPHIFTLIHIQ